MPLLLPLLDPMVDALLVIAVLALIVYIARGIVSIVQGVIGNNWITSWFTNNVLNNAAHTLSHWMGQALRAVVGGGQSVDAFVGASLHRLAAGFGAITELARELRAFGVAVASAIAHTATGADVGHLLRGVRAAAARTLHDLKRLEREALSAEKAAVRSIAHGVYPRLRTLEHEAEHVLPREITHLRARVRELEDGAVSTFKWLATHPWAAATTAFAGAVAIALRQLGLGWTRCNNNGTLGKAVCALESNLLGDMLAGLFAAGAIADFRELVRVAQTVEKDVAAGVKDLLNV